MDNVAPTITSVAPTTVEMSGAYVYTPSATDPGADTLGWSLVLGPTGMAVSPTTGELQWDSAFAGAASSALGPHTITLRVDDGDGGTATQTWTLAVTDSGSIEGDVTGGAEAASGTDVTAQADTNAQSDDAGSHDSASGDTGCQSASGGPAIPGRFVGLLLAVLVAVARWRRVRRTREAGAGAPRDAPRHRSLSGSGGRAYR